MFDFITLLAYYLAFIIFYMHVFFSHMARWKITGFTFYRSSTCLFFLLNIKQFYHISLNVLHGIHKFLMKGNISNTWRRSSFFIFYSIHIILFLAIYIFILYLKLSFGLGNTFKFIMDFPCLLLRHVMT